MQENGGLDQYFKNEVTLELQTSRVGVSPAMQMTLLDAILM